MEEKKTITIDDKEYVFDELPETVQHCCVQIQDVEVLINTASLEVQRYKMMHRGYVATLAECMEAPTDDTE